MTSEIYLALEKQLQAQVPLLKEIEWYAEQYNDTNDGNLVWIEPCVFLEFLPVAWEQLGDIKIQGGTLITKVHIVTESAYEDKKRFTAHHHLQIDRAVFHALQGFACMLSFTPGLEQYENTPDDHAIINTMIRTSSESEHTLSKFIVTIQTYECYVYDLSFIAASSNQQTEVTATLDLTIHKVAQL
jgi:hypothetical protein